MSNENGEPENPNSIVVVGSENNSSEKGNSNDNKKEKIKGGLVNKMFPGKKRYVILCVSIIGLSSLFSNIFTIGFGLRCMTEEFFHYEEFNVSLGLDIFEKIDFNSVDIDNLPKINLSLPTITTTQASFFPDFKFEIKTPSVGFNKETFKLMTDHPEVFQKILKTIVVEGSKLAVDMTAKALDPRKIDWSNLANGFNLTNFDPSVVRQFKDYVSKHIDSLRQFQKDANITYLRPPKIEDITIDKVNWRGDVNGRIKIIDKLPSFIFSEYEKHLILGSVGLGVLLFFYPISILLKKLGVRKTVTLCCLLSAFFIALFPIMARINIIGIIIIQILLGGCFSCTFPSLALITESWATLSERNLFYPLLTLCFPLGAFTAYPFGGLFCSTTFGYEIMFGSSSILTLITTIYFWVTYRNSPGESTLITVTEQRLIENGKPIDGRRKHNKEKIPAKEIINDWQTLTLIISIITTFAIYNLIFNVTPNYLFTGDGNCNILTSLVYSLIALTIYICSMYTFNKPELIGKDLEPTKRIKILLLFTFIIIGLIIIFISIDFIVIDSVKIILMFIIGICISFNGSTFLRCITEISRQYLYFVSVLLQFGSGIGLIIVEILFFIVGDINYLYLVVGILTIITGTIGYLKLIYEPAHFTKVENTRLPKGDSELSKAIIKSEIEDTV
ncbi:Major facilitator superfamily and Major facilitator superfamily domain, general substrate transporter-containing protein [Strongyloides ratti]|uniref:Major facilitator superfamily and Major facilitator superfamily domain, general substrate transporter-containing protein n=1 Tax=Strongyloides ratti TaxID=34506 RepID=A0A090MXS5_STRRB|nr:Major facilitator superfamily and Major facilitator superfamily domain, general substrate transporter-containing protein [Strongyloides ratti]CEF65944.1 Major facilitator superfamily and Major facilitator superfamily domain, general substrate transporter-containing protein [Strongyloides ratti]